MTGTPGTLEERLRVPLPEGMCGQSMGCNAASICLCSHIEDQRELLTEAADEIASLRARVEVLGTVLAHVADTLRRQHTASPGHTSNAEKVNAALDEARQALKDTPVE